ncbi:minor capsid protein [Halopelagius fulvigenes]|uniref:Minor capsid protein n=1 Tax=Halopelagius fulvigenes TaxID=1198324 RepID=A0ABD5TYK5_9EURY
MPTPPTKTKTEQQQFAQKLRGGFASINTVIRRDVGRRDRLGLTPTAADALRDIEDLQTYAFATDSRKHEKFMAWLRRQFDRGVLEPVRNDAGEIQYVRSAYEKGIRHADTWLQQAGASVPAGTVADAFTRSIHIETVEQLYTRTFNELEGITSATGQQMSRVLSDALTQGWGAEKTARELTDRIDSYGKVNATRTARTEIPRAHNEAAKTRYREADVERVKILGHDPCEDCQEFVGNVYPIDDIPHGGPPFHPQCQGTVIPVLDDDS